MKDASIEVVYPVVAFLQAHGHARTCYRWESTSAAARKVFTTRYRLLPYLYTAFYDSHTYGCPVARPLFFTFPADNTTRSISEQWMMGDALLVSPILYEKTTTVRAYFPKGTWYDFYTGRVVDASAGGKWDYVSVGSVSLALFATQCVLNKRIAGFHFAACAMSGAPGAFCCVIRCHGNVLCT